MHNNSFFVNKVCQCGKGYFHPWSLNWPNPPDWQFPPKCRCGSGYLDSAPLRTCAGCQQEFYDWFSHPRRGFYQNKKTLNPVGWFCYSCLENALPVSVICNPQNHIWFKTRIPPIPELIPPDYRHAAKVVLPTEVQANLDDFLAKLRGIVECPTVPNEPS